MNCHEIREQFSAPASGGTSLTEWALSHAHVAQCADCQAERVSLQLAVSSRPGVEPFPGLATARLIGQLRLVSTRVAPSLTWLRSSWLSAFQRIARATRAATGTGATRVIGLLTRLHMLVSGSLTVCRRAAGRTVAVVWAMLTRVTWRLAGHVVLSARAVAEVIDRVRSVSARVPRRLSRLGSAAMIACLGVARAASLRLRVLASSSLTAAVGAVEAAWAMLTRVARRLPAVVVPSARATADVIDRVRSVSARVPRRLGRLGSAAMIACQGAVRAVSLATAAVSRSSGEILGAAGRVVEASRVGAMRTRDVLVRIGGRVPELLAPSARAVGHIVGTIPDRVRAHPRVCTGIAGVAVLVAALMFIVPRLSPDEPGLRDVRLPVDRKAAEPIVATPFVIQVAPAKPASGPPPPRVATPETHAAIPVPVRRSNPVATPLPTAEATPTTEASDPAAAIDWLLKGNDRRQAERP
jgi:hypothetical protein